MATFHTSKLSSLQNINPIWPHLCYFLTFSFAGFLALKLSIPTATSTHRPKDFDVFFTSVSAVTVSSTSTVEMEDFSNTQLIIITILMLVGGEVFTSMLPLYFFHSKLPMQSQSDSDSDSFNQIELSSVKTDSNHFKNLENGKDQTLTLRNEGLKHKSIKLLSYVVTCYLVLVHVVGSSMVFLYVISVPSARQILRDKRIQIGTFSLFTTVSTFANCGFVPTNENMMVFEPESGLLLLLIPQMFMGNTLYAPCLRLLIWVLEKTSGRVEFGYMLRHWREMGYDHLLSASRSWLLALTALFFVLLQFVVFCCLEWSSGVMDGLGSYRKLVGALFQTVNSRHTGESVFDLSLVSPAILVMFIFMMRVSSLSLYSFSCTSQREKTVIKLGDIDKDTDNY